MAKQTHLTVINLDRPRIMRFDLDAMAMLEELVGANSIEDIRAALNSFSGLRKAAYCALLLDAKEHGETLTLDNIGDILSKAEYVSDVIEKVVEAVEGCFRQDEKEGTEKVDESTKN